MVRFTLGLIITAVMFFVSMWLISYETSFLENQVNVSPQAGMSQQDWLQIFQDTAFYQAMTAVVFTVAWLLAGIFHYRVSDWRRAGGRLLWALLMVAMLFIIVVIGWTYTERTQSDNGKMLAILFYCVNALLIFYVTTLIASPTAVKYAPVGAASVNRLTGGAY